MSTPKHTILTRISAVVFLMLATAWMGCEKLEEKFQGDLSSNQLVLDSSATDALVKGVYVSLGQAFINHLNVFPLTELTTDAGLMPTRGADWDDNGVWRSLHQHRWTSQNNIVRDCFNSLNGVVFAATDALKYRLSSQQEAEVRMIRAFAMYLVLDLFDQVPYRDPGESTITPSRIRKGEEALNYIIAEVNDVLPRLPAGPPYRANQMAARVLLMKCYLNRAVYLNRASPVFNTADMNQVVRLADELILSNRFPLSDEYFDNFAPENDVIGKENIFTQQDEPGPGNQLFFTFLLVQHYNQLPFGLNGAATLASFYNRFEGADHRRGMNYLYGSAAPNPGNRINVGFFVGQQYNPFSDDLLYDEGGQPLIFEPGVKNIETGPNLQRTGIRPLKYPIDWSNPFQPANDMVYFRMADVILMKAEAVLRGGTATAAGPYGATVLSMVNAIRTHASRQASPLSTITLDSLLDERGRELWWEGWRRQDMIRFGKYLQPFEEKQYVSEQRYLLFPIPAEQLSVNPNLKQNPGY